MRVPAVTLTPFTADLLPVVRQWFTHPDVRARLGGPEWPERQLALTGTGLGETYRGRRVLRSYAWIALDADGVPVADLGGEVYDRWCRYREGPAGPAIDRIEAGPAMGLAYAVDPARWGRGYGRAALLAAAAAPELADVRVFALGIEPDNVASARSAAAAGYAPDDPEPDWEDMIYHVLRRPASARTSRSPSMTDVLAVSEVPFPVTASQPGVWRYDERAGAVLGVAPARTDFYVNPGGADSADAETMLNAATLLGLPPSGDFQFSARVSVDFQSQYDAGVLMLWSDERHWGKFCFELSPSSSPMVVSVITRGVSDDANAFVVTDRTIWLRVSRIDRAYAYHASTDGTTWQLVRVFHLGDNLADHRIGFEVQSPTGDGCAVTFDHITFTRRRVTELRDGS
jgi:hypothetical protein